MMPAEYPNFRLFLLNCVSVIIDALSGNVQEGFLCLPIDTLKMVPATVVIHGYPAAFLYPVEPIFIFLKIDLVLSRFPNIQDFVAVCPDFIEICRRFLSHLAVQLIELKQKFVDFRVHVRYLQPDGACLFKQDWIVVRWIFRIEGLGNLDSFFFVINVIGEQLSAQHDR